MNKSSEMNKYFAGFIITVLILIAGIVYVYSKIPKVAYVSTNKVYNEYKGKKEYQNKLDKEDQEHRKMLDTLKYDIEVLNSKVTSSSEKQLLIQLEAKAKNYERLRAEFEERIQYQKQQYVEDLWKQINAHIEEYGAKNKYDYIYGAEGTGALMYANKGDDITDKVIEYVNSRYEGK